MECAKQWGHELDQMPDVRPTFHGNGLIQDMWRGYQPKKNDKRSLSTIAVRKPKLISDEYKALNAQLHNENLAFGVGGAKHAVTVVKLVQATKSHSVLDYGCGKGYLAKSLPFPIWEYDPAVEGKAESPRPADVVTCFDVLEHVEPEKINFVLGDLQRCVLKVGYFVIHTGPSSKTLSDGRNAHILQQPRPYWETILAKYFEIGKITEQGPLLHVVVGAKRVPTVTPEQIVDAAVRLGR